MVLSMETVSVHRHDGMYAYQYEFLNVKHPTLDALHALGVSGLTLQFGRGHGPLLHDHWNRHVAPTGITIYLDANMNQDTIFSTLSGMFCASIQNMPTSLFNNTIYARIPQESACTENLTPLFALLPCGKRLGLSTQIDPLVLLNSKYMSMSLYVSQSSASLFIQSIQPTLLQGPMSHCPHFSTVHHWDHVKVTTPKYSVPLKWSSWVGGYGDDYGILHTAIHNPHDHTATVSYYEQIPWYFYLFLHTAQWQDAAITHFYVLPAKDRVQPSILHYTLSIQPHTTAQFNITFQKGFLQYKEYKPDAHRGLDLGSIALI